MDISIQVVDFKNSERLENFTKEKLMKFFGNFRFINVANVFYRLDERQNVVAELKLLVNSKEYFVKGEGRNHNSAIMDVIKKMRRNIEKYKNQSFPSHP